MWKCARLCGAFRFNVFFAFNGGLVQLLFNDSSGQESYVPGCIDLMVLYACSVFS